MNVKKPSKAKGLATRIGNINGKILTNASMPLKNILKTAGMEEKTGSFALPSDHGPVVSDPKFALQQGVRLASSKSDVPKSSNVVASDLLGAAMVGTSKDNGERLADECNIGGSCEPNVPSDS